MYKAVEERFRKALRHHIHERYKTDVPIVTERPPRLAMGEAASPVCFELAKRLKKPPRALAQEIANSLKPIAGIARVEVAGGGYLNAFFDRAEFFRGASEEAGQVATPSGASATKTVVEHTSINPNKAAHIGHLRNAVLGDTFARILRYVGRRVEVQNYIDNTGVQVADVVLGFLHVQPKSLEQVRALAAGPKFDYLCWDLYAQVTRFLAEDKSRLELRSQILKDIEEGHSKAASMAEVVSTAVVQCHLETVGRLGIDYDLLTRESEILRLKFWDAAFDMLRQSGAIELATSGKNAGCWVMQLPSDKQTTETPELETEPTEMAEAKIIVRSNGTVTYVGKDIAYHLWKFGLLPRDFYYEPFYKQRDEHEVWITSSLPGYSSHVEFGHAHEVFNVIDSRQAYPQKVVVAGLRALGHAKEADHLKHFAYNVVALTPRCALEMGYEISPEDAQKPYIEVSGRKGQGVKADDLIDQLMVRASEETKKRHPDMVGTTEFYDMVQKIAIGSLRYFLLRFTRSSPIAFDFKDALNFEGETGPYVQYAIVRVNGILRKGAELRPEFENIDSANLLRIGSGEIDVTKFLTAPAADDIWDVVVLAGSLDARVDATISGEDPAILARYALDLAQAFNAFYHKHHILSEEDEERRAFLLRLTGLVREQLVTTLGLLGITAPEKM